MRLIKKSLLVDEDVTNKAGVSKADIRRGMLIDLIKDLSDAQIEGIGTLDIINRYGCLKEYHLTLQDNITQQTYSLN